MTVYEQNGRWYYNFMTDYKRYHGACKNATDEKSAKNFETVIKSEVLKESWTGKKGKPTTFKQAIEKFLEHSKANKLSYKSDVTMVNNLICYFSPNKLVADITTTDINKFKIDFKNTKVEKTIQSLNPDYPLKSRKKWIKEKIEVDMQRSDATLNRYVSLLSKMFNLLIADGLLKTANPCHYSPKLREQNSIRGYKTV